MLVYAYQSTTCIAKPVLCCISMRNTYTITTTSACCITAGTPYTLWMSILSSCCRSVVSQSSTILTRDLLYYLRIYWALKHGCCTWRLFLSRDSFTFDYFVHIQTHLTCTVNVAVRNPSLFWPTTAGGSMYAIPHDDTSPGLEIDWSTLQFSMSSFFTLENGTATLSVWGTNTLMLRMAGSRSNWKRGDTLQYMFFGGSTCNLGQKLWYQYGIMCSVTHEPL